MNHNGMRDRRETIGEAWARLGLIKPDEPFGRRAYVACVANAAAKLVSEGFLPPGLIAWYVKRAELEGGASGAVIRASTLFAPALDRCSLCVSHHGLRTSKFLLHTFILDSNASSKESAQQHRQWIP
jgi:hypothetical protein